jgi:predicted nucleic-acid-binding protein
MIGIDTNILLRLILKDDVRQLEQAEAFMRQCSLSQPAFISLVTLIETIWALDNVYNFSRKQLAETLTQLTSTAEFCLQDSGAVAAATQKFASTKADFADALIAAVNQQHGCEKTISFDRAAIKSGVMAAL